MNLEELLNTLTERLTDGSFIGGTISQPRTKSDDLKRVRIKPVELRGELHIQFEYQFERILQHENVAVNELYATLLELLERFRQVHAEFSEEKIHVQVSKKFKVMWKSEQMEVSEGCGSIA